MDLEFWAMCSRSCSSTWRWPGTTRWSSRWPCARCRRASSSSGGSGARSARWGCGSPSSRSSATCSRIPLLQLVGGLLLVWIAVKLVRQAERATGEARAQGTTLLRGDLDHHRGRRDHEPRQRASAVAGAAEGDMLPRGLRHRAVASPSSSGAAGCWPRLMNRYAWIIWLGGRHPRLGGGRDDAARSLRREPARRGRRRARVRCSGSGWRCGDRAGRLARRPAGGRPGERRGGRRGEPRPSERGPSSSRSSPRGSTRRSSARSSS